MTVEFLLVFLSLDVLQFGWMQPNFVFASSLDVSHNDALMLIPYILKCMTLLDLVCLMGLVGRSAEVSPTKQEEEKEPGRGRHHAHPGPQVIS